MPIQTADYLLQADWLTPDQLTLAAGISSWLLETDSLTARLKSKSKHFQVQLLSETEYALPTRLRPELAGAERAVLREVILRCNQQPMVYAQSWLPLATLQAISPLAELGEQPLGEFIFRHPALQRGPIELARLDSQRLGLKAECPRASIWARRSVFMLDQHPLQVVEAFLPEVYQL
ncbi:MAG: chorismate lyase [Alkalimonas sp.]|nr:chorismate lyase [Alkalimonas sp.]